jgi:hypothetical protein
MTSLSPGLWSDGTTFFDSVYELRPSHAFLWKVGDSSFETYSILLAARMRRNGNRLNVASARKSISRPFASGR